MAAPDDLRPRTRLAVLLATALLGIAQIAFNVLPDPAAYALLIAGPFIAMAMNKEKFTGFVRVAFSDVNADSSKSRYAAMFAFLFLLAALVFLEWRQPFYFTEDDNFTMGPVAIAAARGFMAGDFPTWNPYQYMGQPTSVQSMYGLTYPFTYLAFAIVHWLRHDEAYVELLVIGHILAGYFAMYWAARTLKVRPLLAATSSLTFILSGTALMIARDYATMAPLYVWMPLLIVAAERLRTTASGLKWAVLTALAIGLFCHSGNGQMWVYGVLFFGLALLLNVSRKAWPWIAVAALFSLSLSLLLIVPQMWFVRTLQREPASHAGIAEFWLSLLLPTPLTRSGHPQAFPIKWDLMTPFYYAGTTLTLITLGALVLLLAVALHGRRLQTAIAFVRQNAWLLCAGIAICMAFGDQSLLWNAMKHVPVVDRFGGPWKLVIFFHLFSALAAAVIVERLLSAYRIRPRVEYALVTVTLVLVGYSVYTTRGAFTSFGDQPYPELPRELVALLKADPPSTRGRIMAASLGHYQDPGYVEGLARNFASWYELSNVHGYDRFVAITEEARQEGLRWHRDYVAAARAYGVRWFIVHRSSMAWFRWQEPRIWHPRVDPFFSRVIETVIPYASKRLRRPDLVLWELPDVDPLAFVVANRKPLPIELRQNGVNVDVRGAQNAIVVNFLNRPGFTAHIDGTPVPHQTDEWGRIVVRVPAGAQRLELRYSPPWRTAAIAAACVFLAGVVLAWIVKRS